MVLPKLDYKAKTHQCRTVLNGSGLRVVLWLTCSAERFWTVPPWSVWNSNRERFRTVPNGSELKLSLTPFQARTVQNGSALKPVFSKLKHIKNWTGVLLSYKMISLNQMNDNTHDWTDWTMYNNISISLTTTKTNELHATRKQLWPEAFCKSAAPSAAPE